MNIIGVLILLMIGILGCNQDKLSIKQQESLLVKGNKISSATFLALSAELQQAMSSGGVSNAINYCNIKALPITDSLSIKYNVKIKRTSDKVRNQNNIASKEELKVIQDYKTELKAGKKLKAQITSSSTGNKYYAPIITNTMCLKCHGNKSEIDSYNIIANLYPDDLATGYKSNEVRGIWSIKFLK